MREGKAICEIHEGKHPKFVLTETLPCHDCITFFDIHDEIIALLLDGHIVVDQGMMIPNGNETELFRDMTIVEGANEYCFSFSSL